MAARVAASHAATHNRQHRAHEAEHRRDFDRDSNDEIVGAHHLGERPPHGKFLARKMTDVITLNPKEMSLPCQANAKALYETPKVQLAVAGLIFGNFIVSACSAQILPEEGDVAFTVFYYFDWFFNGAFLIELLWNMYGNFFLSFWRSGWNVFDFFIVGVSITSLAFPELPGISVLRLFRAFRVFRLFKRVKSLRLIIVGVIMSLPGVMNAFIVLLLFMCIWAIMGVDFFGDDFVDEYGNFYVACLTHFQIMTLDSWASGVARPIMESLGPFHAIFFISYVFINSIMMVNVVVAILLEKFVAAMNAFENEDGEDLGERDTVSDLEPMSPESMSEQVPLEIEDEQTMLIREKLASMSNYSEEMSRILTLCVQERGLL
jgi:voltage-gated sodium channel